MQFTHKGSHIFYTDQGTGEPLVLIHGFLENSTMWNAFLPELIKKHRVLCIDMLGHGHSECIGYIHTMRDMADVVKDIIDSLDIKSVTIIGHSMGGYVGCAFAKAYPKALKALCLLNATPDEDHADRKRMRIRANQMAKAHYEQLIRMSFINLFDPKTREEHKLEIDKALIQALKTPIQGYIAANEGMRLRDDIGTLWKNSTFKKGMILGETDWIIDAVNHKKRFESYTHEFAILTGGHMSHISNREITLHTLLKFLR